MNTENITPQITDSAAQNIEKLLGDFDFGGIINSIASGEFSPDAGNIINRLISLFLGELRSAFVLVGSIAAVILIGAFIKNLDNSFGKSSVSQASGIALFLYIATIAATAFQVATGYVLETLQDITIFVHSIIPSMTMLCISGGEMVSATMSHPVMYFICSAFGALIKNVITPLVLLRAVCTLLCAITGNDSLSEFTALFSKLHKTLLALSMSLFAGIMGISSFAAASFDSLAARGVKFAISASVPVVGGSISEAMSSVAGSAMLLKNAVGLGGVIVIFAMFAIPLLKMWALSLAFRLTAAFTAPISEKTVSETLRKLGECIDMFFSSIASIGTVMIIAIASIL
ncbi:MAG: stage III sporulation protein AE [Clostridia bacterium]|nr:stage III sporulation protein AE [Clostridia bacterium]